MTLSGLLLEGFLCISHLVYCVKCSGSYENGDHTIRYRFLPSICVTSRENTILSPKTAILSDIFTSLGQEPIFTAPSKTFSFNFLKIAVLADGGWYLSVI